VEASSERVPPGQYVTSDFPVLSAGPTPRISTEEWRLRVTTERGEETAWTWDEFSALPVDVVKVDIHCVTKWSKLDTDWRGVSVDTVLKGVGSSAAFVTAHSYGGYTTNLPVADLTGGKAWIAFEYDGQPLAPEHGGPARLLVPHLYFWKSAKWIHRLELRENDRPGFWESLGYHGYGDPWKEQRYAGD
jgi:DMSO/TMAO reductase YedYZ molybdopterin-dependent catalytic subunit